MIDDELASPVEQVGEGFLAARRIEDIILLDFDPGKLAALGGKCISLACELLRFAAASPPAETVLATTIPRVARQNGHIVHLSGGEVVDR